MRFTKMHGLGNDYVYVDTHVETIADAPGLSRAVSDRHTGIGSDGLILIGPSDVADVRMEMYNADGSRAQMCGNGIRCVAKYTVEHGLAGGPDLQIETDSGTKFASCQLAGGKVVAVRVDMGPPDLAPSAMPAAIEGDRIVDHWLTIAGKPYMVTCVSMGNPHAVVFVDDVAAVRLHVDGPRLENAAEFPQRTNVQFATVTSPRHIVVRTWERGSGATRACGTGASAVCVAGALTERSGRSVTITLPGGDLELEWAPDDHVYMTGPAVEVFSGEW